MTEKKTAKETKASTVIANDPDDMKGTLKNIGGSRSDHWNNLLANQTVQALWLKHSDPAARDNQYSATVAALVGIGPKDELEGMMAAQLIAAHNASGLFPGGVRSQFFLYAGEVHQLSRRSYTGRFGCPG